ncbi:MAG: (2Fe-2S)-binding protein [Bacillota bacterium]
MRIADHPILGPAPAPRQVTFYYDGRPVPAREGEPIAAALVAFGVHALRTTARRGRPRGLFCAIGRCTDCVMTVDGVPNVRTCVTPVREGLRVETQRGLGEWRR